METLIMGLSNLGELVVFAEANGGFFSGVWEFIGSIIKGIYGFTGNWGVAIIVLTIIIKLILFPSTMKQNKSMQDMQKVQPEIKKIQEKYKDDKQTQQQKLMEVYQKHNVNPFSSCLPLLIQLPILIALFQTILRLEELHGATFLWIDNLAGPDTLLAVITGATMFLQTQLQQKWSGAEANPQMKTMGMVMPVMIIFIGRTLPSGVLIYWFTSNLIMIGQQYLIKERREVAEGESS